jgi:hypothetical protein
MRTNAPSPPVEVRWAARLFLLLALLQLAVAALFVTNQREIGDMVAKTNAALAPAELSRLVRSTVLANVAVRAGMTAIYLALIVFIRRGRNWARITATVVFFAGSILGLSLVGSLVSVMPSEQPAALVEQGVSLLSRLVALWLLWFPLHAREFFVGTGPARDR